MVILPVRFWLSASAVLSHSTVNYKTGSSSNRNYAFFDGYHAFYGAPHPFVLWIECFPFESVCEITINYTCKNLIMWESGSKLIRPIAARATRCLWPFGSGSVSFPLPVACQLPQTYSITGSWRRLDRLDRHGAEFFYVNLGLLKPLRWKKAFDKFYIVCESPEMWQSGSIFDYRFFFFAKAIRKCAPI